MAAGELRHRGEVVFAVESELPLPRCCVGAGPGRAAEAFARLRVWDTEANNGVLLYLLLADHRIEIVADRGLRGVAAGEWAAICRRMEARMTEGEPGAAVVEAIDAISAILAREFPRAPGEADVDELPNRPVLLG
jgi:uncharacterized membrane protein